MERSLQSSHRSRREGNDKASRKTDILGKPFTTKYKHLTTATQVNSIHVSFHRFLLHLRACAHVKSNRSSEFKVTVTPIRTVSQKKTGECALCSSRIFFGLFDFPQNVNYSRINTARSRKPQTQTVIKSSRTCA